MNGMKMIRPQPRRILWIACSVGAFCLASGGAEPAVVLRADAVGPRVLERETEQAVIRDYLRAWQNMSHALAENQSAPLDDYFVGVAKEKLAATVRDQQGLGMKTRYADRSHDIHLVFYSPEGLSIELLDTVEYDVQILDKGRSLATEHVRARYVAVLTPTEVRWKVRVFQATPEWR